MRTASSKPSLPAPPASSRTADAGDPQLARRAPDRDAGSTAIVVAPSRARRRPAHTTAAEAPTVVRVPAARNEHPGGWTSIERAAAFLGVQVVTLRRAIGRGAQRRADGSVIAQVEGIIARKLGRVWRVWLDAVWRNPSGAE